MKPRRKRADSSAQVDIVKTPLRDQAHAKAAPESAAFSGGAVPFLIQSGFPGMVQGHAISVPVRSLTAAIRLSEIPKIR
jgi:hypothetical protein